MSTVTTLAPGEPSTSAAQRRGGRVAHRPSLLLPLVFLCWPVVGLMVVTVSAVSAATASWARAVVLAAVALAGGAGSTVVGPQTSVAAVRAGLLAPFTIPAVTWGYANGGVLHVHGDMLVMTGMSRGYGPRSGVTIGQVFLTSDDSKLNLLAHEARHSDQWLIFGGLLPPLYLVADLLGGGPGGNVFEINAGLESGGYA